MGQKINWGILGAAAIAETTFIPAINKSGQAELFAIASRNLDKARSWAKKFSLPRAYGSYEELLADPEIEVVYISLPNHLHFEWTVKALKAAKHVLCEKPLALSAVEVKEMFAEAEKNRRLLMEGFMYRFHPRMARTQHLIKSGAIGEPRLICSSFTIKLDRDRRNYRWSREMGGGALYDLGCYTINAARAVFGTEPEEVVAVAHFDEQTGIDLTTSLLCPFPGNRQALLAASFELEFQSSLEISGSQGRIFLDRAFSAKNFETEIQINSQSRKDRIKFQPVDQFQLMIEHFGEVIKGQAAPLINFQDSYGNALVIEKALKQIHQL